MKDFLAVWVAIAFWLAGVAAWGTAILNDADNKDWGWLALDILLCPVGLIRGLCMWMGVL